MQHTMETNTTTETEEHVRYDKEDIRYWRHRYMMLAHKIRKQKDYYRKVADKMRETMSNDKTLLAAEVDRMASVCDSLIRCADDMAFIEGKAKSGLSPADRGMIDSGNITP